MAEFELERFNTHVSGLSAVQAAGQWQGPRFLGHPHRTSTWNIEVTVRQFEEDSPLAGIKFEIRSTSLCCDLLATSCGEPNDRPLKSVARDTSD